MANVNNSPAAPSTPIGYPKLAEHMGEHPDFASFRRFGALSSRNILYYQAELLELEEELEGVERRDHSLCKSGLGNDHASTWYWLGGKGRDDQSKEQLSLVLKLREILHQYNEALIQEKTILAFPDPKWSSLQEVRYFNDVTLNGTLLEAHPVWGSITHLGITGANDLVGLREHDEQDSFSKFVEQKVSQWFHRQVVYRFSKSVREQNNLTTYKYKTLQRSTALVTTILACLLPILSISALFSIRSMKARLGAIAGFNILLSVCLGVFTTAKRVEIFGVTAAFAAVQVVFVSSNGTIIA